MRCQRYVWRGRSSQQKVNQKLSFKGTVAHQWGTDSDKKNSKPLPLHQVPACSQHLVQASSVSCQVVCYIHFSGSPFVLGCAGGCWPFLFAAFPLLKQVCFPNLPLYNDCIKVGTKEGFTQFQLQSHQNLFSGKGARGNPKGLLLKFVLKLRLSLIVIH